MHEEIKPHEHIPIEAAALAAGIVLAGSALYKHLRPEISRDGGENFYDIVDHLDEYVRAGAGSNVRYVMIGGGTTEVLMDSRTEVSVEGERIKISDKLRKDQFRKDNGTKVDVDLLVLSDEEEEIEAVRASLTPNDHIIQNGTDSQRRYELGKPGAKLKIGVTGLVPCTEFDKQATTSKEKLMKAVLKDWVSHRLKHSGGSHFVTISDIRVGLPDEYFNLWQLELKSGNTIPVLHPLLHILCYPTRASHGLRARDQAKVTGMMENVGEIFGATLFWGSKNHTANIRLSSGQSNNKAVEAVIDFCDQKNSLRWEFTKERLGKKEAGLLAARIALHRQLDTRKFFLQFGQGGWIYDNLISKFSRER